MENWQQKALAIQALTGAFGFSIKIREVGNWYVSARGINRKEGGCLSGGLTNGATPEDAVNQFWDWALDPKFYLVFHDTDSKRRAVKWNGFMWQECG